MIRLSLKRSRTSRKTTEEPARPDTGLSKKTLFELSMRQGKLLSLRTRLCDLVCLAQIRRGVVRSL
jgi:hypothetical protein